MSAAEPLATEPEFLRASAVAPDGSCTIAEGWSTPVGAPNGGYISAIILRAMIQAVGDPERAPRSITLHYLRPPQIGPAHVAVTVERSGRTISTVTARLQQGGKDAVLAIAAFASPFEGVLDFTTRAPDVPAPEDLEPWPTRADVPIAQRFELRPALGAEPFSGADEALTGGWIRLREPAPLDAPHVAMLTDAWLPASFPRLTRPAALPTIDLTIHLRAALPLPEDHVLAVFRSTHAEGGMVEEDGTLWTRDGRLIAQSRQLALLR